MKAMIFAAGLGTRLRPLTDTMPKALVPVDGRPLIEIVARKLRDSGFREAVVNVHHFADMICEWVEAQDIMEIRVSDERARLLETGGGILHARESLQGSGSFLVHNVDILSNADLRSFARRHRPDALATLLVSPRESSRHFLFRRDDMRLAGWENVNTGERIMAIDVPVSDCIALSFSGIHIISDSVFPVMDAYISASCPAPTLESSSCPAPTLESSSCPARPLESSSCPAPALESSSCPAPTLESSSCPAPTGHLNGTGSPIRSGMTYADQGMTYADPGMTYALPEPVPAPKFSIRDFYLWAASRYPIYGINDPDLRLLDVGKVGSLKQASDFLSTC